MSLNNPVCCDRLRSSHWRHLRRCLARIRDKYWVHRLPVLLRCPSVFCRLKRIANMRKDWFIWTHPCVWRTRAKFQHSNITLILRKISSNKTAGIVDSKTKDRLAPYTGGRDVAVLLLRPLSSLKSRGRWHFDMSFVGEDFISRHRVGLKLIRKVEFSFRKGRLRYSKEAVLDSLIGLVPLLRSADGVAPP